MPLRVTNSPNLSHDLETLVAIEIVEEGLSRNDDFAFFLALGDNFGVLGEEKRRKKNADHNKWRYGKPHGHLSTYVRAQHATPTSLSPLAAHVLRRQLHRRYER